MHRRFCVSINSENIFYKKKPGTIVPGSLTGRLYVQSTKDQKTLSKITLEIRLNVGSAIIWREQDLAFCLPNNQHNYQYSDMHKLHIS